MQQNLTADYGATVNLDTRPEFTCTCGEAVQLLSITHHKALEKRHPPTEDRGMQSDSESVSPYDPSVGQDGAADNQGKTPDHQVGTPHIEEKLPNSPSDHFPGANSLFGSQIDADGGLASDLDFKHGCSCLINEDYAGSRRLTAPSERDVDQPAAWSRRMLKLPLFDFLGTNLIKVRGQSNATFHVEPLMRLRALTTYFSAKFYVYENVLGTSVLLDLVTRWFIQHPPTESWMRGYIHKWLLEHPRGRGMKRRPDDHTPHWKDMMKAGFKNIDEYRAWKEKRDKSHALALRQMMEVKDLGMEQICPNVDPEMVVDGSLKIQKLPTPRPGKIQDDERSP